MALQPALVTHPIRLRMRAIAGSPLADSVSNDLWLAAWSARDFEALDTLVRRRLRPDQYTEVCRPIPSLEELEEYVNHPDRPYCTAAGMLHHHCSGHEVCAAWRDGW